MPLAPGSRRGSYEVASLIGVGGIGEVYRARDTTLARDVALKILPEAFASDPEQLARLGREAQLSRRSITRTSPPSTGWKEATARTRTRSCSSSSKAPRCRSDRAGAAAAAKGREADERSDIWAFGCVRYEMLTGRTTSRGILTEAACLRYAENPRVAAWNDAPKPFVWHATADVILEKVRRCKESNGTPHELGPSSCDTGELKPRVKAT